MTKLTEEDIRLEINNWSLTNEKKKEVFTGQYSTQTFADYVLKPCGRTKPLIVTEAKKTGEDLEQVLQQTKRDAKLRKTPITYAVIGKP